MNLNFLKSNSGISKQTILLVIVLIISSVLLLSFSIYAVVKHSQSSQESDKKTVVGNLNFNNSTVNNSSNNPIQYINNSVIANYNNIDNDVDDNNSYPVYGTPKSSSSLTVDGVTVNFNVPPKYTSTDVLEYSFMSFEYFADSTGSILVTVTLESNLYSSVEEDLNSMAELGNYQSSDIQSITVNNKEFKYIEISSSSEPFKEIYAICDTTNNTRYSVRATTYTSSKENLSIDTIKEFLQISI